MGTTGSKTYKVQVNQGTSKTNKTKNPMTKSSKSLSLSPLITNQGGQGSCYAHSTSKLILKNIFENYISLKLSGKEEKEFLKCFHIKTDEINIDRDKCSIKGYHKILLFLYNYFNTTENYGCDGGDTIESLNSSINDLYKPKISLPKFFKQTFHTPILIHLLEQIKKKIINVSYEIIEILNKVEITEFIYFIEKILDTGLYVNLILENDILSAKYTKSYIEKHGIPSHSVTVVGYKKEYDTGHFIIKNSWGNLTNTINYDEMNTFLYLGESSYIVKSAVFLLPILKGMERYDYVNNGNVDYVVYKEIWPQEINEYKIWITEYCRALKKSKFIK
uniref:Peptidase C1A papain C-terminal domain-containing protein n=1 Tax=viral metagenome TaxID=1070528 RepID=A0A6C0EY59_9ZZZZ